jgi:hypothetical protein
VERLLFKRGCVAPHTESHKRFQNHNNVSDNSVTSIAESIITNTCLRIFNLVSEGSITITITITINITVAITITITYY